MVKYAKSLYEMILYVCLQSYHIKNNIITLTMDDWIIRLLCILDHSFDTETLAYKSLIIQDTLLTTPPPPSYG